MAYTVTFRAAAVFLFAPQAERCSIRGRVLDDRGRGVAAAAVNAVRGSFPVTGQGAFGAVTNARGEYCINVQPEGAPLPAGRYTLRASVSPGPPSASPSCQTCRGPSTAPRTTFGPALEVSPNRPAADIDIRLQRGPVYCVRGEVQNGPGALVLRMEDAGASSGVIQEGGRFLLSNLEPGVYTLILMDGPQLGRVQAERRFEIRDQNIEELVIAAPRR